MSVHLLNSCPKILLIDEEDTWIAINHNISKKLGNKKAAILQKIHYWLTTSSGAIINGMHWVYNTYDEWSKQLGIAKSTLRRLIYELEEDGIILSGNFNKKKSDRTKWYTIAYDVLRKIIGNKQTENQIKKNKSADNVITPYAQNEHIPTTRITSDTVLNRACAREPLPLVEKEQPGAVEASISEQETAFSIEEEAFKVLDLINTQLDKPMEIFQPIFKNTLAKRMRTHFGAGKGGLDRFREYCAKWANNAFLMGKKAMRSGDLFRCSVGSILSEKMIEASWENKGFFQVYAPPTEPTPPTPEEEDDMGRRSASAPLPPLTLCDVLESAETPLDKAVKTKLYQALGDVTYQAWFHTTGFVAKGIKRGEPDFFIHSGFAREYVITHYGNLMKKAFESAAYGEQGIELKDADEERLA